MEKKTKKKSNSNASSKKGNTTVKKETTKKQNKPKVANSKDNNKVKTTKKVEGKKDNKNKVVKEVKTTKKETKKEKVEAKVEETKKEEVVEIVETKDNTIEETTNTDKVIIDDSDKEEKNNKTALIALLSILLIFIGVCIYYQLEDKEKKDSGVSETESSEIMDDFYKYYNSKKAKVIYYASSSCGYCELQTPIMEQIKKDYDIDYLYIDSTKLTSSDREAVLGKLDIEHATPTTVVVKDGKVMGKNIGYVDGKEMVEFLKSNKILKEDAIYTPEANLTMIDYSKYKELISSEGKSIITIGQTGCSHCIKTKPVLNTIAKDYGITINYLNLTDMSEDESKEFYDTLNQIEYNEESYVENGSFGTPLTLVIKNGKVIGYVNGERPTAYYVRVFKKAGIISE